MWAFLATLLLAASATAQKPPAWSCGTLVDYYANKKTYCAPASCNAKPVNIQGDVIILDVDSYGEKQCQGCNPQIPSTCCQACQDTDGCNAWTICTLPDGCGSGCKAYGKGLKGSVGHDAPLPHKQFGNFKDCNGDKWPANMCTLKIVKDPKKPTITSTNAADGWVSGVVPKTAADPRCPATMSAKSCKACLGSRNPTKCFSCLNVVKTMFAADTCTKCANLTTPAAMDACVACAASPDNYDCMTCTAASGPNGIDACFACQAKAMGGVYKAGAKIPAKAAACARCFESYNVPIDKRDVCTACVLGGTDLTAIGCSGCFSSSADTSKCLGCLKRAKVVGDASACASCSQTSKQYTDACFDCALKVSTDAKQYCSRLFGEPKKSALDRFYQCLATAQDSDRASACSQCYRNDPDAEDVNTNKKCYDCIAKVTPALGIYCSHCWKTSWVKEGRAVPCESCVLSKLKTKESGDSCI